MRTEVVLTYNGACKKKESEIVSEQSMVNKNKVGNCLNNIFFYLWSQKLKTTGLINSGDMQ